MNKLRKFLLLSALIFSMTNTHAEDVLTVSNVTLPQNGEVALEIKGAFDANYTQFQLEIELDKGATLFLNNNGRPWAELGDKSTDHSITGSIPSASTFRFVCSSMSQEALPESEVLMRVKIIPNEVLEVGTVLNGTVKGILFNEYTGSGNVGHEFDDIPFTITIGNPVDSRIVMDENSSVVPDAASGVDVRVFRTIKANEWSTICLPFEMSEAQIKSAFGDDVELADFSSWSSEEDDDGNIVSINIEFTDVTEIEANHPYVIKVTGAINEFTVDGVDIEVDEEPTVQVGKKKAERGYFTGCYVANSMVPEYNLFLNGNKFWYSKGLTKMKAFRGYFELADVLTTVEEAGSRIFFSFNHNETTGVIDVRGNKDKARCEIYDLQGRKVQNPAKGLYIRNGRKEVVK